MINEGISKFTFYLNLDEPRYHFMIVNRILKFYIFHSKYMRFSIKNS